MNRTPDVELVLRELLAEDGITAPDHVLDVVEGRISRQRQRRSWRLPWRLPMNPLVKLGAAAATVLVIAVVGWNLLPRFSGPGGPTTAPSATPSPASSSSAVFPQWWTSDSDPTGAGILPPGRQATQQFEPAFTFTVPDGWVHSSDEISFFALFPDSAANEAEFAASGSLANEIFMGPHRSPYFVCDAWEDHRGETAAELVASMVATEALATSGVVDVEIGGLTGKQFDVRLHPDWTESCPGDPATLDLGDLRTRGFLLDSPDRGVIVVFVGSSHSAGHEAFLAEAMPIIESFDFDLEQ